ncbi:hydrolase [Collibacillus ludicampi]|uniref:Hydrolase n=1 Tax=Collibacillus ludicampi TaxID=2771369 RepID=A0AAV4LB25_9BACL|nr:hydrolase [Collibacillus ludicampi]GIM44976.1 hydrolase [Collibacillus ludicampi]
MLSKEQALLVLVDVQGKLAKIVHDSESLIENLIKLIQGLRILRVPIIWVEQYPEGLGSTIEEVAQYLTGIKPIRKISFNACENETFIQAVKETGRQQLLVAGIETHICVYQTSIGLKKMGYEVQVVTDAVSSRTLANKEIGLEKMKSAGVAWTSVETVLFELMKIAEGDHFKQIIKLLK